MGPDPVCLVFLQEVEMTLKVDTCHVNKGRDQCDTAARQGMPSVNGHLQKLEEARKDST